MSYLERLRKLKGARGDTDENDTKGFPSFLSGPPVPVSEHADGRGSSSAGARVLVGEAVRGLSLAAPERLASLAPADPDALGRGEVTAGTLHPSSRSLADRQARKRVRGFYQDVFAGKERRALVSLDEEQLSRAVRLGLITRARAEGHQVLAYRTGRASCLLLIAAERYDALGVLGILHEATSGEATGTDPPERRAEPSPPRSDGRRSRAGAARMSSSSGQA